jgi:REP element-mobilizing transposase RayT
VQRWKTLTTTRYGIGVRGDGWPPYAGRLWQRDYYEHIIRNEREMNAIRAYIEMNPVQWQADRENPANR